MTIHCLGSINVDHVHRVPHLPTAGETLADAGYSIGLGGKGANQAIAAAKTGADIRFVGAIGADGIWTEEKLTDAGVNTEQIAVLEAATGHAVIYVTPDGENSIVIHGGANRAITEAMIDTALGAAKPGDWWLAQNETNLVTDSITAAKARGLRTAYSAAPFDAPEVEAVLPHLDLLAVNQGEADALKAHLGTPPSVPMLVTTLGDQGVVLKKNDNPAPLMIPAVKVTAVDTTGAGDTFLGSLLGVFDQGADFVVAARYATFAAALSVTRDGAADAIPARAEVDAFAEAQT